MQQDDPTPADPTTIGSSWRALALWQKAAATMSVLVMAAGIAMGVAGGGGGSDPSPPTMSEHSVPEDDLGTPLVGPSGLLPSGDGTTPSGPFDEDVDAPPPATGAAGEQASDWSPAVFRAGFSFFIGFAVAFAVRSFVRISLIGIGLFAMLLFGLQYAGFITVDWTAIGNRYDSIQAWLLAEVSSAKALATGYLPSAGAATAGLLAGFRKR